MMQGREQGQGRGDYWRYYGLVLSLCSNAEAIRCSWGTIYLLETMQKRASSSSRDQARDPV